MLAWGQLLIHIVVLAKLHVYHSCSFQVIFSCRGVWLIETFVIFCFRVHLYNHVLTHTRWTLWRWCIIQSPVVNFIEVAAISLLKICRLVVRSKGANRSKNWACTMKLLLLKTLTDWVSQLCICCSLFQSLKLYLVALSFAKSWSFKRCESRLFLRIYLLDELRLSFFLNTKFWVESNFTLRLDKLLHVLLNEVHPQNVYYLWSFFLIFV